MIIKEQNVMMELIHILIVIMLKIVLIVNIKDHDNNMNINNDLHDYDNLIKKGSYN